MSREKPGRWREAAAWAGLWLFWVVVSRRNHPTLALNAVASLLLVSSFAAATYVNLGLLIPKFRGRRAAHAAALAGAAVPLALACAGAIHLAYDRLWGPDEARFGFLVNVGLEYVLILAHVVAIRGAALLIGRGAPPNAARPPTAP